MKELTFCKIAQVLQPVTKNCILSQAFSKKKSYKTVKNFFQKTLNFKSCYPVHISNIDVWGLTTTPVGLYAGLYLKFCLPVFPNFSSIPVSFSAFVVIFNYNYDEHLTWIKFRLYLISWSA